MTENEQVKAVVKAYSKKGGALSEQERIVAKARFLDAYSRTRNFTASAQAAGITDMTRRAWTESGFISQEDMENAIEQFNDMLRGEILKVAVLGGEQPLIYNGRLVTDDNGNRVTVFKKDHNVLLRMAQRFLPEWQIPDKQDITIHHEGMSGDFIPSQYLIRLDASKLLPDELQVIIDIVAQVEERERLKVMPVVESVPV